MGGFEGARRAQRQREMPLSAIAIRGPECSSGDRTSAEAVAACVDGNLILAPCARAPWRAPVQVAPGGVERPARELRQCPNCTLRVRQRLTPAEVTRFLALPKSYRDPCDALRACAC